MIQNFLYKKSISIFIAKSPEFFEKENFFTAILNFLECSDSI